MTTEGVKALVVEVLEAMVEGSPTLLDEHVTRRVCERIESTPRWLRQYSHLCDAHSAAAPEGDGKSVVNSSIGWWAKRILGAETTATNVTVSPGTTSLIKSYNTLRFSQPTRKDLLQG